MKNSGPRSKPGEIPPLIFDLILLTLQNCFLIRLIIEYQIQILFDNSHKIYLEESHNQQYQTSILKLRNEP